MKKIMFNDKFGLTESVLQRGKTVTRRIAKETNDLTVINGKPTYLAKPQYQVGEILAIAQSYEDIIDTLLEPNEMIRAWIPESAGYRNKMFVKAELMPHQIEILDVRVERLQDITDEDCMKEGIYFDYIERDYYHYHDPENRHYCYKCEEKARERLISKALENRVEFGFDSDEITDEWIKEELGSFSCDDYTDESKYCDICGKVLSTYKIPKYKKSFNSPRDAFASLIDKVSGKGTWKSNPYVFRYEFKLK